jgi:hypothetical protein
MLVKVLGQRQLASPMLYPSNPYQPYVSPTEHTTIKLHLRQWGGAGIRQLADGAIMPCLIFLFLFYQCLSRERSEKKKKQPLAVSKHTYNN